MLPRYRGAGAHDLRPRRLAQRDPPGTVGAQRLFGEFGHVIGGAFPLRAVEDRRMIERPVEHRRRLDIARIRSEEHTSELQSLMRISYAVFCLKQKTKYTQKQQQE